jgi:hypothetical protein
MVRQIATTFNRVRIVHRPGVVPLEWGDLHACPCARSTQLRAVRLIYAGRVRQDGLFGDGPTRVVPPWLFWGAQWSFFAGRFGKRCASEACLIR